MPREADRSYQCAFAAVFATRLATAAVRDSVVRRAATRVTPAYHKG
jgi:hypothetical protein